MTAAYEHKEEFSQEEYAAIGQLIRALSQLEYEVGKAALKLLGARDFAMYQQEKKALAEQAVRGGFGTRLEKFLEAYGEKFQHDVWSDNLKDQINELLKWRNGICHGVWTRGKAGRLNLTYYDRASFGGETGIPVQTLSVMELVQMSNCANYWSWELHERFKAL